jgi:hypothetical protein
LKDSGQQMLQMDFHCLWWGDASGKGYGTLWLGCKLLPLDQIDGLSWGEKQVGTLLHGGVAGILPLHLSLSECSLGLKDWLSSWAGPNLKFLEPIDWSYAVQQGGDYSLPQWDETWAWILAPAAAQDALEELGKGQLKRHKMLHGVVIVPTLLTCEWYQWFQKKVDIYFTIPAGSLNNWSTREFELLMIGLYLPLLWHRPWDWKWSTFMVLFGRLLSAMYKEGDQSAGNASFLWQFLNISH